MQQLIRTPLTKEILEQKYLLENLTYKQIAQELGFNSVYVGRRIREFDIPRRPQCQDITGQIFGHLTVLRKDGSSKRCIWICRCVCQKEIKVVGSVLRAGDTKSCGCIGKVAVGGISGGHFGNIRNHAKTRHLKFDITINYIWDLFIKQHGKCALSGVDLHLVRAKTTQNTASLDRIDSSKGYIEGNVQWVHKQLNAMKSDLTQMEFFHWVDIIYSYQHQKS